MDRLCDQTIRSFFRRPLCRTENDFSKWQKNCLARFLQLAMYSSYTRVCSIHCIYSVWQWSKRNLQRDDFKINNFLINYSYIRPIIYRYIRKTYSFDMFICCTILPVYLFYIKKLEAQSISQIHAQVMHFKSFSTHVVRHSYCFNA